MPVRYRRYIEKAQRNPMYVAPKFEPVFMEPPSFLKEYETQVCRSGFWVFLLLLLETVYIPSPKKIICFGRRGRKIQKRLTRFRVKLEQMSTFSVTTFTLALKCVPSKRQKRCQNFAKMSSLLQIEQSREEMLKNAANKRLVDHKAEHELKISGVLEQNPTVWYLGFLKNCVTDLLVR